MSGSLATLNTISEKSAGAREIVLEHGIQYEFSAVCGVYAIIFIYFMSKKVPVYLL